MFSVIFVLFIFRFIFFIIYLFYKPRWKIRPDRSKSVSVKLFVCYFNFMFQIVFDLMKWLQIILIH